MSEHSKDKKVAVTVTPEAWHGFYSILDSVSGQLSAWATKHDLPPSLMVGAAMGLTSAIAHFADLCDCDTCMATPITFADEVINRIMDAESKYMQAVH